MDGDPVGLVVGEADGAGVGEVVGDDVVGETLGLTVGLSVGAAVGTVQPAQVTSQLSLTIANFSHCPSSFIVLHRDDSNSSAKPP